jgi:putative pyruvate formate lyase activating enzyme
MSTFSGFSDDQNIHLFEPLNELKNCILCPHECGVDRLSGVKGFCRSGAGFAVSAIVAHYGEEPVISGKNGICNVFFAHCNLQCVFCQNHQISNNTLEIQQFDRNIDDVLAEIYAILDQGSHALGFVSPSHMIPQMKIIVQAVRETGRNPIIVYNTNGYDKVDTLKSLEGFVDVYLPDIKYFDPAISKKYSGVGNYPEVMRSALKEMYRQKGSTILYGDEGVVTSGLIIRHLVLPGEVENSKQVLNFVADEFFANIAISLMSQYFPAYLAGEYPNLSRKLNASEYQQIIEEMEHLGFYKGWIQEMESADHYQPDFQRDKPFQ